MKYFIFIFLFLIGNLSAQTNTTNTPSLQALSKLVELNAQASYLTTMNNPDLLLKIKQKADVPNYEGNAYAAVRRTLWLRIVRGEPINQ
jgi:hypothetical protein